MEPAREETFGRIVAYFDGCWRSPDASLFETGPFTLYPDYARPTPGASRFTADDLRSLVALANEDPPWASLTPSLIVEWGKLSWITDHVPTLAVAASDAGLAFYEHPLLIIGPDADPPRPPLPDDMTIKMDDGANLRELIAAWESLQPIGTPPTLTAKEALEQIRIRAASLSSDYVDQVARNRSLGRSNGRS